jgi:hypothetical protein
VYDLALLLIALLCAAGCQSQQTGALPTETPVGYVLPAALTTQAALPTETPLGYVPPPTSVPPYATPTWMPMFFVNGAFTAQVWPGTEVVLFWDVPQAAQVWIVQQTMGVWCPGDSVLKQDAIYGPLPPTGVQRVTIAPQQAASLWFDLYTDTSPPSACEQAQPSSTARVDVSLVQPVLSPTPFPAEYFLVNDYPLRSIDNQGIEYYDTPLGEYILLTWSQRAKPVYLEVQPSGTEPPLIYGPLPSTSALKVCPGSGTRYTLYAGGQPGEVAGTTIHIYQSPSAFQYWVADFVPCWE